MELFMKKKPIVDGVSDEFSEPEVKYDSVDGLYYSHISDQVFEAKRTGDVVEIAYVEPMLSHSPIEIGIFYIQLDIGFYEPLAVYAE
jgi:hypothetical protein